MHPFKVGHDHAAAVGENVGHDQHAVLAHDGVGFGRGRAVRAFDDDFGAHFARVFGSELVFQRAGGEYVHIQRQEFGVADFFAVARLVGNKAVGAEFLDDGVHVQPVFVVNGDIDGGDGDDFCACLMGVETGVEADVAEALDGVGRAFDVFAELGERLHGSEIHAVAGGFVAGERAAEFHRFAGEHAGSGFFDDAFVFVDHPRHDFAVGVHIGRGDVDFFAD